MRRVRNWILDKNIKFVKSENGRKKAYKTKRSNFVKNYDIYKKFLPSQSTTVWLHMPPYYGWHANYTETLKIVKNNFAKNLKKCVKIKQKPVNFISTVHTVTLSSHGCIESFGPIRHLTIDAMPIAKSHGPSHMRISGHYAYAAVGKTRYYGAITWKITLINNWKQINLKITTSTYKRRRLHRTKWHLTQKNQKNQK